MLHWLAVLPANWFYSLQSVLIAAAWSVAVLYLSVHTADAVASLHSLHSLSESILHWQLLFAELSMALHFGTCLMG